MMISDVPAGWEAAYQAWLEKARPLLEAGQWQEGLTPYPRIQCQDVPFAPVTKPLSAMKLGVVSTAGFYLTGAQLPFTAEEVEGDPSFREFPASVLPEVLSIAHTHYPHDAALADWNVVLPLDHLRAMVAAGELGGLGPVYSISGFCTNAARLVRESAEAIADRARQAGCDAVLMVPV